MTFTCITYYAVTALNVFNLPWGLSGASTNIDFVIATEQRPNRMNMPFFPVIHVLSLDSYHLSLPGIFFL